MRVIHREAASNEVAVIEDDTGANVRIVGHRGMSHGAAIDTTRLAEHRANQIEVVNRVEQDLEPRHSLEERPVVPRRMQIEPHLDVEHVAEDATRECVFEREHVGGEAKLKIHGRDEAALAAYRDDASGVRETAAQGLLNKQCGG